MSTTHGQPGLSSDQRSTIRSTILSTRHTLEDELRRQLEKYGIYETKKLPHDKLTHLSAEEIHTRRTLDAAIERELESTEGDLERSITNYVREATKTYLNRFVALKTIEVRGLVEETITERPEYGNRSYMHHTVAEITGELTNAPDDGYGAALELAYQEIGAEIRMIFEESEHTVINLDVQVREEVLDELDAITDDAWESDEALGWVYQYFGEDERKEIDERVNEENYKISGTDIATKTQLFTPRHIVEWMVDNSLGRLWLEMRGGRTNITHKDNCFYLAPIEESLIERDTKPVEEITVLDPACGSGHMLFYAFDVLYQMYLEEGEVPEKYIPREILRNNLYGVDIDSGATRIAALSLYLKAKGQSPDVEIPHLNIVSADAVLINGERKEEILNRAGSELEREILEQIWNNFGNIRELGSLVQIEDRIDEVLDEYREEFEATGQVQFTSGGELTSQSTFVAGGNEESWDEIKSQLMQSVHDLASQSLEHNEPIEEMFAAEVGKTVELLDVLHGNYDVVVSNPPYLQSSKMGDTLKQYIRDNYKGKTDLFGAFIERCLSFTYSNGYSATITPANFMFLYYWRGLRKKLLNESNFIEALHLSDRDEAYMNIATLLTPLDGEPVDTRFSRIVEADNKIAASKSLTENLRETGSDDRAYVFSQKRIEDIGRQPFLYWFGEEILQLFNDYPSLEEVSEVLRGLDTGDDDRFVRAIWEVAGENDNWKPYATKSSEVPFYESVKFLVDFGEEINEFDGSIIPSEEYFGNKGLLFRRWGKHFVVKDLPAEVIPSDNSPGIYTEEVDEDYLLGYLNSSLVRFIMNGLNPGLNFQVGDTERIPVNIEPENNEIGDMAEKAVSAEQKRTQLEETRQSFDPDFFLEISSNITKYLFTKDILLATREIAHGKIDEEVFEISKISEESQNRIYEDLPNNLFRYPRITRSLSTESIEVVDPINDAPTKNINDKAYSDIVENISNIDTSELRELSEELNLSPHTIALIKYEEDLYNEEEKVEAAGKILSFILGRIFGRWEGDTSSQEEPRDIISFDSSYSKNIAERIYDVLDEDYNNSSDIIREMESVLGNQIEKWLRNRFFRYHHVDEYKRRGQRNPIYWQLESSEGAFSCYLYYHEIDANTLPKLRGQYLDPRINELENEIETLNAQTNDENPDKELLNRKEEVQNDLDDINEFRETIDEMIDEEVTVDIKKGIWENIKEWDQYEVLQTGLPKLKSSYSR